VPEITFGTYTDFGTAMRLLAYSHSGPVVYYEISNRYSLNLDILQ